MRFGVASVHTQVTFKVIYMFYDKESNDNVIVSFFQSNHRHIGWFCDLTTLTITMSLKLSIKLKKIIRIPSYIEYKRIAAKQNI
jgi:hypothetical protein